MHADTTRLLDQCVADSHSGVAAFSEIVGRLIALGVERYHVDYSRGETTFYLPDGDSHVVPSPHEPQPTRSAFDAAAVQAAVQQSQRNEHGYPDFVRKTMAAGCVGYFVQITGRRAIYFGRDGEIHVELFPPAPTE
ncbi:MAG: DUF1398 family protein [Pirellulales bacterium]